MASAVDESDEYLPGDDSEGSDYEDEGEEERPNRWRGPKSTWRQLNSEEIDTFTAIKEIQDRDLSVHLYDAFALKQRHRKQQDGLASDGPIPGKDINAETGQLIKPDDWLPQRTWTAWPMRADKVPPQDFARTQFDDSNERFTFRKATHEMPSTALEEVISATILRTAKEKFNARPWVKPDVSGVEAETEEGESEYVDSDGKTVRSESGSRSRSRSRSRSKSKSVKHENASGDERMDVDIDRYPEDDGPPVPYKKRRFKPTTSADDDLSYSLLRPSVRHIITKLDATLTILHNTQESALNYHSDSADSEASDSSRYTRRSSSRQGSQTPTAKHKGRGRPLGSVSRTPGRGRSRGRQRAVPLEADPPTENREKEKEREKSPKKLIRGRPKKTYPRLEGETDRDFAMRVARLRKEPIPIFADDPEQDPEQEPAEEDENEEADEKPGRDSGNSGDGEDTAGPSRPRPRRSKRGLDKINRSLSPSTPIKRRNTQRTAAKAKMRLGLRDWRDVLGAAALAGFPAAAVDRAARRCADLFGQSMALHTLVEGPVPSGRKASTLGKVVTYVPGMPYPPLLDPDVDEEDEEQRRMTSTRAMSMAPGATSEDEQGPSQRRIRSRSVSRSVRTASAAPGTYLCSFRDCPRAAEGEGFSRRQNLLRHLKLVHGWPPTSEGEGDEAMVGFPPEEVDSEDEMLGAVHVDRFLKPVRMRQGWRAGDAGEGPRRRKGGYGRGRRSRGRRSRGGSDTTVTDDDGDTRMSGAGRFSGR
ncbi:hypothetical protein F4677DRAFT_381004 [Hypoxylon crocopeplum]|nr:hypothetical protein F4677DRAFT_381004 [Hypoxylon crocopeplum]